MAANIIGKWECKTGNDVVGFIHMTFEFFNDGTYKYVNHITGAEANTNYSVSGNQIYASGTTLNIEGNTLCSGHPGYLTFYKK